MGLPGSEAASGACSPLRIRLVDVDIVYDCDDEPFLERTRSLLGECVAEDRGRPELRCSIRGRPPHAARLEFDHPEPFDWAQFALDLFGERGFREGSAAAAGERVVLDAAGRVLLATAGRTSMRVETTAWRSLAANLAINRAFSLQPRLILLHAASISIGGRGVVLCGPKGAGKSTLSLALASLGHGFLGDEIAALRSASWALTPFRRAASIRPGPQATRVARRLAAGSYPTEELPDGTVRTRARVSELFPEAAVSGPVPLAGLVFLTGFAKRPRLRRLPGDRRLIPRLQVLPVSLLGEGRGRRVLDFLRLVHEVPCFALEAGAPDETAALLETTLEPQ